MSQLQLYIDDSGSRFPNHRSDVARADGMDWFALGGVLIDSDDLRTAPDLFDAFKTSWGLDYPLHSTKVRGRRGEFRWLGRDADFQAGANCPRRSPS